MGITEVGGEMSNTSVKTYWQLIPVFILLYITLKERTEAIKN